MNDAVILRILHEERARRRATQWTGLFHTLGFILVYLGFLAAFGILYWRL